MTALLLAASLAPAAPLPCRVLEGELDGLETEPGPLWILYVRRKPGEAPEGHVVAPGMVLVVEGRRANLGELPGLFNQYWPSEGVWRVPRAKSCRAWLRGGRLEALEVTLR
jgi:hypothetical protein